MAVNRTQAWQTDDGKLFATEDHALAHEAHLKLTVLMRESGIGRGGTWDEDTIRQWMVTHARKLTPIFRALTGG